MDNAGAAGRQVRRDLEVLTRAADAISRHVADGSPDGPRFCGELADVLHNLPLALLVGPPYDRREVWQDARAYESRVPAGLMGTWRSVFAGCSATRSAAGRVPPPAGSAELRRHLDRLYRMLVCVRNDASGARRESAAVWQPAASALARVGEMLLGPAGVTADEVNSLVAACRREVPAELLPTWEFVFGAGSEGT